MDDFVDEENIRISVNKKADKGEEFLPKVPQICLLEVQSSTESDKTVLSTTTVFEQQLRAINSDCSLPSSPGLICATSGNQATRCEWAVFPNYTLTRHKELDNFESKISKKSIVSRIAKGRDNDLNIISLSWRLRERQYVLRRQPLQSEDVVAARNHCPAVHTGAVVTGIVANFVVFVVLTLPRSPVFIRTSHSRNFKVEYVKML